MLAFSTLILSKPERPSSWSGFSFDRSGIGVLMPAFSNSFRRFSLALLHVPHEGAIQMANILSADSSIKCRRWARSSASVKSKTQIGNPQVLPVEWSTAMVRNPHWWAALDNLADPAHIFYYKQIFQRHPIEISNSRWRLPSVTFVQLLGSTSENSWIVTFWRLIHLHVHLAFGDGGFL